MSMPFCRRVAGLLATVGVLTVPAAAQEPSARIEGQVHTTTGAPVSGAQVLIERTGQSTAEPVAGQSDAAGRFAFVGVRAGTYLVLVSATGLSPAVRDVVVTAGEVATVGFRLAALVEERVNVIGEAARLDRIPGAGAVLDRRAIEGQAVGVADVHTLLRRVPGVNLQEEDGYGLRPNIGMRGSGSERSSKITLMEDGVLIAPAPYAAPAAYYFPTVARMEAIEVLKGASQVRHGPATNGGVLNLVSTPVPGDFRLRANLSGGMSGHGRVAASLGDTHGPIGWLVESYRLQANGFKELDGGGDTGVQLEDYLGKLRFQTSPGRTVYQELELKLGYTKQVGDETYLGLTDEDFAARPLRRYAASAEDEFRSTHEQYQARHLLARRAWDVTTVAYRNNFDRAWYKLQSVSAAGLGAVLASPDTYGDEMAILKGGTSEPGALTLRNNHRTYYSTGVQSVLGLNPRFAGWQHQMQVGVRYHRDEEDRFQQDDRYGMITGRMVLETVGTPGSQDNRVHDARAWAAFLTDTAAIGRWTLSPGVRVESIELRRTDYARTDPGRVAPTAVRTNDLTVVVPSVGVTFAATPAVSLFGGVHRGFSPPGPGSTEDTEAERSMAYEAGVRSRGSGLSGELVGFVSDYENLLGRDTLSSGGEGSGTAFNGGAALVRGLEASLIWDRFTASRGVALPVRVAYTFTATEFRSAFESEFEPWGSVRVGDELPYTPRHQVSAALEARQDQWAAALEGVYVSRMRTEAGQGLFLAGTSTDLHLVVNVTGQWRVREGASLVASIQNVTNRHDIVARHPAGVRPNLPRQAYLGLSVELGR